MTSERRDDATPARAKYRDAVSMGEWLRRRVFDAAIVLGALGATVELVVGGSDVGERQTPLALPILFELALILPLLARRRFPFAVPAGLLVFAAVVSFADGRLVPYAFFSFSSSR
jgi:hypothetical protein